MAFHHLNRWWGEEETQEEALELERMMQEEMARHMQLKIELNIEDQDKITVTISPDAELHLLIFGADRNLKRIAKAERSAMDELIIDKEVPIEEFAQITAAGNSMAMWAGKYKEVSTLQDFPNPSDHTCKGTTKRLDQIQVRDFTLLHADRPDKLAPAAIQWSIRIALDAKEWDIISSRYNSTFLSPTDFHLHYRHIIHRGLAIKNRFSTGDNNCQQFRIAHSPPSHQWGDTFLQPLPNPSPPPSPPPYLLRRVDILGGGASDLTP
jgi:hypothetical protein